MRQELKSRWLAALRSGRYAQGRGYLKCRGAPEDSPDGKYEHKPSEGFYFCCLGVLCEVEQVPSNQIGEGHWDFPVWEFSWSGEWQEGAPRIDKEFSSLPPVARGEWGLSNSTVNELIRLNDGGLHGMEGAKSFEQIADWIEANLPGRRH